jgi:hypothetical protein
MEAFELSHRYKLGHWPKIKSNKFELQIWDLFKIEILEYGSNI